MKRILSFVATTMILPATVNAAPYVGIGAGIEGSRGYDSALGSVIIGYSANIANNFVIDTELFAEKNTLSLPAVRKRYGYGLGVLPGLKLNQNLTLFVRLGLIRSRFDYDPYFGSSQSAMATAKQLGLGGKWSFNNNWSIRGEVISSHYNSHSWVPSDSNQAMMSLIYSFN